MTRSIVLYCHIESCSLLMVFKSISVGENLVNLKRDRVWLSCMSACTKQSECCMILPRCGSHLCVLFTVMLLRAQSVPSGINKVTMKILLARHDDTYRVKITRKGEETKEQTTWCIDRPERAHTEIYTEKNSHISRSN